MQLRDKSFKINGKNLSTSDIYKIVGDFEINVSVDKEVENGINDSHQLLNKLVKENRIIYGVNTSLGGFVNWLIPSEFAQELQENLISSVASNVGPYFNDMIVRATILSRLNSLARGNSGISLENFNILLQIYNSGIIPCIPSKGSLGASGDLGPLASIALVATGKWKAKYQDKIISGEEALNLAGIKPMKLGFKEGLSLINGTSAMVGLASLILEQSINLIKIYDVISCLTFEGLKVKKKPFNPIVHREKPHLGQLRTAENIWAILSNSQMIVDEDIIEKQLQPSLSTTPVSTNSPIEDAYSIRCTPQIVGPIRDSLKWIKSTVINELNSSNDNPLILCGNGDVFHNGHFHGQYIAMAMDHLAICLTTLSNLSDRRIDRFMDKNHSNGLPAFLCREKPGIRMGLMGGQFMSTSLTAENRSLCHPVSVQTLTSTGDFQDIVSLGLVAARRAQELFDNTCYIIAFELLCGVEAAELRDPKQLSKATMNLFGYVREIVPSLDKEYCLTDCLESLAKSIKNGKFLCDIEKYMGEILL